MMNENTNTENLNKTFILKFISLANPVSTLCMWISWFAYTVVNGVLVFFHEPWRDEVQAWLISRDLTLLGIIQQMKYEGHPSLWHLLLAPFSKLSFPLLTLNSISLIIMCMAAYLFLRFAPFFMPVKIICLFSSCFVYFYPVIARSYCLIPLFLFLTAMAYKDRLSHPIRYGICLALLTQTHVILLGLYGMLTFFFFLEEMLLFKNRNYKTKISVAIGGLSIAVSGFFLLCLQILGSLQTNTSINISTTSVTPKSMLKNLYITAANVFYDCTGVELLADNSQIIISRFIILLLAVTVLVLLWLLFAYKPALIFIFSFAYQVVIYTFIAGSTMQRSLTLPIIFLFCLWISDLEMKEITLQNKFYSSFQNYYKILCFSLLLFLCLSSYPHLIRQAGADIKYPYSNGKEVAAYIKENLPPDAIIVCTSESPAATVAAYLPTPMIWNAARESYQTYTNWDDQYNQIISYEEMKTKVMNITKSPDQIYVLFSLNSICNISDMNAYIDTELIPIAAWDNSLINDEKYFIYKMTP